MAAEERYYRDQVHHVVECYEVACVHYQSAPSNRTPGGWVWFHLCRGPGGRYKSKVAKGRPTKTYNEAADRLKTHMNTCKGSAPIIHSGPSASSSDTAHHPGENS